jgi:hypothetical protein
VSGTHIHPTGLQLPHRIQANPQPPTEATAPFTSQTLQIANHFSAQRLTAGSKRFKVVGIEKNPVQAGQEHLPIITTDPPILHCARQPAGYLTGV